LDRFGNEESAKLYGWSKIQVGHPTKRKTACREAVESAKPVVRAAARPENSWGMIRGVPGEP
jgi:hypothetical protein